MVSRIKSQRCPRLSPWHLWLWYVTRWKGHCRCDEGYSSSDGDIILNYAARYNLVTWVFKNWEPFLADQRHDARETRLTAAGFEDGGRDHKARIFLEAENSLSLQSARKWELKPYNYREVNSATNMTEQGNSDFRKELGHKNLDFSPVGWVRDFNLQNCMVTNLCCFKMLNLW